MAASSSSSSTSSSDSTKLHNHHVMVCHHRWRGVFKVEDTMTNRVLKQQIVAFVNTHAVSQPHIGIDRTIDEDSFELRLETIQDEPLQDAQLVVGWAFIIPCVVMVMKDENGDLQPIQLAQYAPPRFIPAEEYKQLHAIAKEEVDRDPKGIVIE